MSKVFIAKGKDPYKNTLKLLEMAGSSFLNTLKSPLVIKPNLVMDTRDECASSDPKVVRAVVDHILRKARVDVMIIAEGSSMDTVKAYETLGYNAMFEDLDVELRDLNKDKVEWINIVDPLTGRPQKLPIAETLINARCIISAAMLKTHDHGIVTMGLKNLVGAVPGSKWKKSIHGGRFPDEMAEYEFRRTISDFHKNILEINKRVRIDYSILDATCSMEGDGPCTGKPRKLNYGIGGADPVAVDAVGAYLMGFDPYEVGYIYLCEKANIGTADLAQIQVEPANWVKLRRKFKPHRRYRLMQYKHSK